jgi:hypothetical protein
MEHQRQPQHHDEHHEMDGSTTPEKAPRPWWMTGLAIFCLGSVAFLVPRDLFLARTRDVEVWFGFELHGTPALLTAPIHWAIFLTGAWGFWLQRSWILPCAAAYAFYIAFCHLVWSEASPNGNGWLVGVLQAAAFSVPGFILLYAYRQTRHGS